MKFAKIVVLLVFVLTAQLSFAASVNNTEVTVIMLDRSMTAKVFIKTSVARPAGSPTCHTNSWAFVLPLATDTEKAIYSALLSAKTAGKKVNLIGTAECGTHSTVETLNRVEVL